MGLGQLQLVTNSAGAALDQGELARGINALPLLWEAHGARFVVHRGVDQAGSDAAGERGGGVVLGADDEDVLAGGPSDRDLERLVVGPVERLHERVKLLSETRLHPLKDEVDRGLVSRGAKGAGAAIVAGNLVQVP